MKVVTVIQARTTSTRLPNKALIEIYGKSLLERVVIQSKKIKNSDELWVATSNHKNDDLIEWMCERLDVNCFRGSLEDVRGRFYDIAINQKADILVRITADNPLTEPEYAEELISFLINYHDKYDYVRMDKSVIPAGTYSEAFTTNALVKSVKNNNDDANREHVTPAIINEMKIHELKPSNGELISKKPYSVGVDTFSDLKKVTFLYKKYGEHNTLQQIIKDLNKYENTI